MERKINSLLSEYQPQISEIRSFIFGSVIAFIVGASIGLIFNRQIILKLFSFFDLKNVNLVLTSPYQFVNLAITLAIICGIVAATPVFLFNLFKFVRPALNENEFKLVKKLVPASIFLFIFGCFFGGKMEQFIVSLYSKTTTDFAVNNMWDIEKFLSQIMIMSFTMGLVFQLPIVMTILIKSKMVPITFFTKQRRYFYVGLTLFGIILPPTDVVSLMMIITPLFILFEGTLLLNRNK